MPLEVRILVNDEGGLSVQGPIDNKLMIIGILEVAKDAVYTYHREQKDKKVQLAPPGTVLPPIKLD